MIDPTTAPVRLHLGAGGLVISGSTKVPDADGVCYLFTKITGWDEPPALSMEIQKRTGEHGTTAGKGYQGERNIVIEGWVLVPGNDPDQLRAAVDKLFAALPLEDEILVMHEHGLVRHLYVRQGGQPTGDRIGRKAGRYRVAKFNIQLVALSGTRLSGDGSGPTLHAFTTYGDGGALTVGTGDGLAPPHQVTVGECTNPRINTGTPADLSFELTIPAGQTLQIDLAKRTATLNGSTVTGTMRGSWPVLARKVNTFTLTADTITPETTFAVDTYTSYP